MEASNYYRDQEDLEHNSLQSIDDDHDFDSDEYSPYLANLPDNYRSTKGKSKKSGRTTVDSKESGRNKSSK